MTSRVAKIAKDKALQSSCTYKVSAIGLNKKGEVTYKAFNKSRFMKLGGGIHAEMEVMLKGGPGIRTIIICRVGNSGDILPIHPCEVCRRKSEELGIRIVSVGVE
jgi:cytidine deaminase